MNPQSLANLRPWKPGDNPRVVSPGRPKDRDFRKEFVAYVIKGQKLEPLFDSLIESRPDIAMAYLAGKPPETLLIGGAEGADPIRLEALEIARRLRAEIVAVHVVPPEGHKALPENKANNE